MRRRSVSVSLALAVGLSLNVIAGPPARADAAPVTRAPLPNFDPLRASDDPVELTNAPRALNVTYTYQGRVRTLREYLDRAAQGWVVLDDDRIVNEWYAPGYSADSLFQTWSIAKPFTAHAVGIAHTEGKIKSLDDTVGAYVPELAARPYGAVTIRNLLRMASGIRWNSDMDDYPLQVALSMGWTSTLQYAAGATAELPQGTKYSYNSLNSAVLALVLSRAVGQPYHRYIQEKIWGPAGMASDAYVGNDSHGNAMGYCCYYVRDRDLARYGLLMLKDGRANGRQVLPSSWLAFATAKNPVKPDQSVAAVLDGTEGFWNGGFGGQMVYVSPRHRVTIVKTTLYSVLDEAETLTVMRAVAAEVAATR
ncbi:serine hydrolase domain-containing protein [Actinomadura flavalba]|uniref:serine hydrolase domain-containing protein n=1 Tax=Actinomadura flavalba TaxID=1120938 RepID=UPI000475D9DE|nr:serine hydrolase [Actinomadura flavalba]